jgi:two-component system LytT family response regulator
MNKIRTLIVDDEPLARSGISAMLKGDAEIEVVGSCADGRAAVDRILDTGPDLVFLDVQMPRLNGIEVLEQVPAARRPETIFVTAYDQYALKAFELCAVDYLLKPFREGRFHEALGRAKERIRQDAIGDLQHRAAALFDYLSGEAEGARLSIQAGLPRHRRLVFRVGTSRVFVSPQDIVWVEAQGDRVRLSENGQIHTINESLQSVETRLDPTRFARVHRSFIVNLMRVRKVTPLLYGDCELTMGDGTNIPVGRACRASLKTLLPPANR